MEIPILIFSEGRKRRVREESAYTDEAVKKIILKVIAQKNKQRWISLSERVLVGKKIFNGLCGMDVLQFFDSNPMWYVKWCIQSYEII